MRTLIDIQTTLRAAACLAGSGHPHIGSEHLALLAFDGPDGIAAMAREAGIDADAVRSALERCCIEPLSADRDGPVLTSRSASIAAFACQVALLSGADRVGPAHLALALVAEPAAVTWRGLEAAGVWPGVLVDGAKRRGMDAAVGLVLGSEVTRRNQLFALAADLAAVSAYATLAALGGGSPDGPSAGTAEARLARARERLRARLEFVRAAGWVASEEAEIVQRGDAIAVATLGAIVGPLVDSDPLAWISA